MTSLGAAGTLTDERRRADGARGSEDMMKTIVVPYDETEMAECALARAADLAAAFGSRVIVTSVAPVLVGSREMGPMDPADPPEQHREEFDHAKTFLSGRGIVGQFEMTVGDPASAIVELADRCEADLIIVGTQRPSLAEVVGRMWAAEHKAHCDVLTV
jgi:nucleotide-binding universal stress UspA family protein